MCSRGPFHAGSHVALPYPIRRRMSSPRGGAAPRLLISVASASRFPAVATPSRDTAMCPFKDQEDCLTMELKTAWDESDVRQ
jgi:hypothetical protein